MSKQLNLNEIDKILANYYQYKISFTQISRNMKLSSTVVKNVIKQYGDVFLSQHPEFKPVDNISLDDYKNHISSSSFQPAQITLEKRTKKNNTIVSSTNNNIDNNDMIDTY
tara:strand:- start:91 stop:423 length:333 start_codon:yes stop_codon:yes gene_type:complete